jgi:hypothetical protein
MRVIAFITSAGAVRGILTRFSEPIAPPCPFPPERSRPKKSEFASCVEAVSEVRLR